MEIWQVFLVLGAGCIAGFINTVAGGGSLLTLPLLIFLGLPPSMANGTNRVAIFLQNVSAMTTFHRNGFRDYKIGLLYMLPALLGALIGAYLAIDISGELFNRILAIVMFVVLAFILFKPTQFLKKYRGLVGNKYFTLLVFFFVGLYGGFIQAGVGVIIMAALTLLTDFGLARINALKVFVVFFYTIIALGTFIWAGKVDWMIGLCLAAGNMTGAWLGAHFSVKKGDKWIKAVLVIMVSAFAIKLLFLS
jgi:uncharacterized protein